MKVELPDFLIALSKQLNENENRCTANPFWQVRQKEYLVTEEDYNEHHFEIIETDDHTVLYRSDVDESFLELGEDLAEHSEAWCINWLDYHDSEIDYSEENFKREFVENFTEDYYDLPDRYKKLHFQEVEKVLTTHLTKEDAEWFINRKKHDFPNAYTYVESAYWSPQLKELQEWIKGLSA